MGIEIRPYTAEREKPVGEFNRRLKENGVTFQFPENCTPKWLPKVDNRNIYQEYFLAVENNGTVRGGYILKHQKFFLNDEVTSIGSYMLPLSEGVIDRAHKLVAVQLLADALQRQPLLYTRGMGGLDQRLPRFLKRAGWNLQLIPFYFKVIHPRKFLRNITVLRTSATRKIALDLLAISGIGWTAIKLYQAVSSEKASPTVTLKVEPVSSFAGWTDDIWNRSKHGYCLAAVRDSKTLNILYPEDNKLFVRLRFLKNRQAVGWVVALATAMKKHKQFGNMHVGSIVDCLALPGYEVGIVAAATRFLQAKGVDILVSNQSHQSWCSAFEKSGFVCGPSNCALANSPELTRILGPLEKSMPAIHMNRGDGGGPINL